MMRQKKKKKKEVVLYRARADWYWEEISSSDFMVTWEVFYVSR